MPNRNEIGSSLSEIDLLNQRYFNELLNRKPTPHEQEMLRRFQTPPKAISKTSPDEDERIATRTPDAATP